MIFLLLIQAHSQKIQSFLNTGSDLSIQGQLGIKLSNDYTSCRLRTFNDTILFGIVCSGYYPLYFDDGHHTHFGAEVLTEADLNFKQKTVISGVDQWTLMHVDLFETDQAIGWTQNTITQCAGITMLGGYCELAQGSTWKEFQDLPSHSSIRVKAVWYFIDDWRGETAYMNLGTPSSNTTVWTSTYDRSLYSNLLNICGASPGEAKFGVSIDIQLPHTDSDLIVEFGSTLEDQPCKKSWGISGFEIYIR